MKPDKGDSPALSGIWGKSEHLRPDGSRPLQRRLVVIGFFAFLFLETWILAGGRAFASPISLTWVHATVRVDNEWGKGGTGFLVIRKIDPKKGKVFLLTNKHIIHPDPQMREKAAFLTLYLNIREKGGMVTGKSFRVPLSEEGQKLWRGHPDPDVDVLAVDITSLVTNEPNLENRGAEYSLFATPKILIDEDITEGDEILVLGYPLGLFHTRTNSPLVRQGILASRIGEKIRIRYHYPSGEVRSVNIPGFLVDAAVLPGSSGSPVVLKPIIGRAIRGKVEMARATPYLLGIISATETTSIQIGNYSFSTLASLGIAFDATTIQETIETFFSPESSP
jgi:hypothetical protein